MRFREMSFSAKQHIGTEPSGDVEVTFGDVHGNGKHQRRHCVVRHEIGQQHRGEVDGEHHEEISSDGFPCQTAPPFVSARLKNGTCGDQAVCDETGNVAVLDASADAKRSSNGDDDIPLDGGPGLLARQALRHQHDGRRDQSGGDQLHKRAIERHAHQLRQDHRRQRQHRHQGAIESENKDAGRGHRSARHIAPWSVAIGHFRDEGKIPVVSVFDNELGTRIEKQNIASSEDDVSNLLLQSMTLAMDTCVDAISSALSEAGNSPMIAAWNRVRNRLSLTVFPAW